jgi:hypothetical protein
MVSGAPLFGRHAAEKGVAGHPSGEIRRCTERSSQELLALINIGPQF